MKVYKTSDILKLKKPTEEYLVPLSANTYGIFFHYFRIRDMDTNETLFEVDVPCPENMTFPQLADVCIAAGSDDCRHIQYDFGEKFLARKNIGTSLSFAVGNQEVKSFRMIERHYFGDKLIKSFDFDLGFCIPNSSNNLEAIYEVPKMSSSMKRDMVLRPYNTRSDSFYFVNDTLIMWGGARSLLCHLVRHVCTSRCQG
eukprot:TRINITY_DN4993_c0_g1_i1.p1 TRINITY_DN4993_c0_g1~~TRINITY_DN4993_c0_g1_i1.p1  ORF type:complete len:199 (-),score=12.94 TRINITY_DN4993_c0_g1_i1:56-652(-)